MLTNSPHIPRTRALLVALACSLFFVASGVVQRAEASFSGGISAGKLTLNADGTDSKVALQLVKGDPTKLGIDLGADGSTDFVQSRSDFTSIVVSGGLGNDTVIVNDLNGVFTDTEQTTIDGGGGADTLLGGAGPETFIGRQGSDTIGGSGGADTFVWSPGDGSDLLEGGAGSDTLQFNGANLTENITIDPNGPRVRLFRDVSNITLDLGGVERIDLSTLGGADNVTAGDIAGLTALKVDTGFGEDTVLGSNGADTINGGPDHDTLSGRGGADTINGGDGNDTLNGGDGNDTLDGGPLADLISCGAPGDTVFSDPLDTVLQDCFVQPPDPTPAPTPDPTPAPTPDPIPAPTPDPTPTPAPAPTPTPLPGPPAGFRGFAKPSVKATRTGLAVTVRSLHTAPLKLRLAAVESRRSYKAVVRTLLPGAKLTIKLTAPRALRVKFARALTHHRVLVRRPKVTVANVATGGKLALQPKLELRR